MFYFKITTRMKRGDTRTSRDTYHEFTKPSHVGDHIGGQFARRDVKAISAIRISQAAYKRATG